MVDAGRPTTDGAGPEPTATAAATTADVPPTATDAVAPGAVDASADPSADTVTTVATDSPALDREEPEGPAGLGCRGSRWS